MLLLSAQLFRHPRVNPACSAGEIVIDGCKELIVLIAGCNEPRVSARGLVEVLVLARQPEDQDMMHLFKQAAPTHRRI
jgi:hypothetical protein